MRKHYLGLIIVLIATVGLGVWWRRAAEESLANGVGQQALERAGASGQSRGSYGKRDRVVSSETAASLSGVVRAPDGAAIAGATVCAWTQGTEVASAIRREPVCARSGADGHYAIEELFPIVYRLAASAPAHQPAWYEDPQAPKGRRLEVLLQPGQHRDGVDIVLRGGGVLVRGVVKDLAGGSIAGASVQVRGGGWFLERPVAAAFTDDSGSRALVNGLEDNHPQSRADAAELYARTVLIHPHGVDATFVTAPQMTVVSPTAIGIPIL